MSLKTKLIALKTLKDDFGNGRITYSEFIYMSQEVLSWKHI